MDDDTLVVISQIQQQPESTLFGASECQRQNQFGNISITCLPQLRSDDSESSSFFKLFQCKKTHFWLRRNGEDLLLQYIQLIEELYFFWGEVGNILVLQQLSKLSLYYNMFVFGLNIYNIIEKLLLKMTIYCWFLSNVWKEYKVVI